MSQRPVCAIKTPQSLDDPPGAESLQNALRFLQGLGDRLCRRADILQAIAKAGRDLGTVGFDPRIEAFEQFVDARQNLGADRVAKPAKAIAERVHLPLEGKSGIFSCFGQSAERAFTLLNVLLQRLRAFRAENGKALRPEKLDRNVGAAFGIRDARQKVQRPAHGLFRRSGCRQRIEKLAHPAAALGLGRQIIVGVLRSGA